MSINLIKSNNLFGFSVLNREKKKRGLPVRALPSGAEEPELDEWPTAVCIERVHFLSRPVSVKH